MRRGPLLLAVALVAVALFLYGLVLDEVALRLVSKPWPVLALLAALFFHGQPGRYRRWIMAGLGWCVLGDVLLELRTPALFLAGMVAFLLGHVCYVGGFLRRSRAPRLAEALPFVAWVGWALWTLWPGLGERQMQLPVSLYTLAILVMMWRSVASVSGAAWWMWSAPLGALLFGFSDTLIALDRFHAPIEGARYPIILTYWAGQALIAASVPRQVKA